MKELVFENFNASETDFVSLNIYDLLSSCMLLAKESFDFEYKLIFNEDAKQAFILCDQNSLEMGLFNIIVNSIEAYDKAEKREVIILGSLAEREKQYVEVVIMDNGCGISNEVIHQMFQPGFTTKGGSGMGFFLANKIIEYHNGWIEIASPYENFKTGILVYIPVLNPGRIEKTDDQDLLYILGLPRFDFKLMQNVGLVNKDNQFHLSLNTLKEKTNRMLVEINNAFISEAYHTVQSICHKIGPEFYYWGSRRISLLLRKLELEITTDRNSYSSQTMINLIEEECNLFFKELNNL